MLICDNAWSGQLCTYRCVMMIFIIIIKVTVAMLGLMYESGDRWDEALTKKLLIASERECSFEIWRLEKMTV